MKSLEILSWFIDALGGFSNGRILVEKEELETIKADLEVLEIIKKKDVDVRFLKTILDGYLIEGTLLIYNEESGRQQLTMEELLKLKQWLEENE